jgi:hypothetical protein
MITIFDIDGVGGKKYMDFPATSWHEFKIAEGDKSCHYTWKLILHQLKLFEGINCANFFPDGRINKVNCFAGRGGGHRLFPLIILLTVVFARYRLYYIWVNGPGPHPFS